MARSLAGFDDVANNINNKNNENANVIENNNNISIKGSKNINEIVSKAVDNGDVDIIDNIIEGKKNAKKLVGIYFDEEVEKVLTKLGKKGGKGAKSRIVNDIVRKELSRKGFV